MRLLRSHWTHAAALALVAAIVHTWPLASAPARLSLHYNADVMLNEWIVAWIHHQLPRAPLDLFDANIFYPTRHALAFSEPLIVPALLGWPVRLAGGSPVLVHNVLLIAGLALSMLAAYGLVHRWTGSRAAAVVAGSAFAFNTHMLTRIEHLQAAHAYGLPLVLLFADRLVVTGHRRDAFLLAGVMTLMAYTSGYLFVFGFFAVAVLLVVRLRTWIHRAPAIAANLALASACAAVVILPVYLPYRRAAVEQHAVRSLENVAQFSATLDGYVASYSRLHHWLWNAGARREFPDAFFPGGVVLALAVVAFVYGTGRKRVDEDLLPPRIRTMAAVAATGAVLSLGTHTPIYGWLFDIFPPLASLRAASRFGMLFLLGMAVLAGAGLALVQRRLGGKRGAIAAAAVVVLVHAEALRAPFAFVPFAGIPGPYIALAEEPGEVVLVEAPFHLPQTIFLNAEYVFNSTAHWRPLMNGYSGYIPATYREYVKRFWDFPDPGAVDAMREAGATHLMLHPLRYHAEAEETLRAALSNPALERVAVGRDGITLFRIR